MANTKKKTNWATARNKRKKHSLLFPKNPERPHSQVWGKKENFINARSQALVRPHSAELEKNNF